MPKNRQHPPRPDYMPDSFLQYASHPFSQFISPVLGKRYNHPCSEKEPVPNDSRWKAQLRFPNQ